MTEKVPSRGEIFVVDDDPAVRDTLSMVLTAGGYQVICFADGAALLLVLRPSLLAIHKLCFLSLLALEKRFRPILWSIQVRSSAFSARRPAAREAFVGNTTGGL